MIKILIDNEEVVCKNNIKIDEKMLSTSSVILNNCYPKSWEQDKDYVSRFYYPKDYSKCKIIDTLLPNKYTQVDYIESTGTQWIDTETQLFSSTNHKIIIDFEPTEFFNYNTLWGCNYDSDTYEAWTYQNQSFAARYNSVRYSNDNRIELSNRYLVEFEKNGSTLSKKINGTLIGSSTNVVDRLTNENFLLLKSGNDLGKNKIYSCKLYIDNILVRDFIPCYRNSDNEVGLYDLVENKFYTNKGTGKFTYGEVFTNYKLTFCGVVKNTGKINLNPRQPHYVDLQILDFKTFLSEGETLNYVITGKTIVEAINQVISSISDYGFVLGKINIQNPNDIINAYSTLNKTPYDVFQYIADITQSRWTTRMIDEDTIAIDFIDPTLVEKKNTIEYTKEYFTNNDIIDMSFNYSTNDYRNKQVMTSDEVYGSIIQIETKIADGYNKNFICDNKLGTITSIKVNGVESSFATKSEEELGISADFIYQPGENTFTSSNTINTGSIIVISYYPIVKGREIVINSSEITRINNQINRNGIISRYENRNDTSSSQELQKIGQSYIKYKGRAEISLKIISKQDLFNKGDVVDFDAPINDLSTEYMVKDKTIEIYPLIGEIFYTFELSSNFNSEDAINYFDNQRAKNQGNIGEGETITRNIDIENTALIKLYNTSIEEIEVLNPTSLNFTLDGVLI